MSATMFGTVLVILCSLAGTNVAQTLTHTHTEMMAFMCERFLTRDCTEYGYAPECGTNGHTYDNRCYLTLAVCNNTQLHLSNFGPCGSSSSTIHTHGHEAAFQFWCMHIAKETCSKDHDPICGSDGKTHTNICEFGKDRCMHFGLEIASYGECPSAAS